MKIVILLAAITILSFILLNPSYSQEASLSEVPSCSGAAVSCSGSTTTNSLISRRPGRTAVSRVITRVQSRPLVRSLVSPRCGG